MSITTWPTDGAHPVIVRVYGADSKHEMIVTFQRDAEALLAEGYEPCAQYYLPGSWPTRWVVFVALMCFLFIGIPMAIRMLLGPQPTGALVVTYVRRAG